MRLVMKLAIFFYSVIILFLACILGLFVLHLITLDSVALLTQAIYNDNQLRVVLGCVAVLIVLINWFFISAMVTKEIREKIVAFDNPSGQVTVSLMAMEDLVRRICMKMPEVQDVRSSRIKATKRGLDVRLNLALNSEVSIPEATATLQEAVKRKILDTMGIDETVTVRIDVTKIMGDDRKRDKDKGPKSSSAFEQNVPFQGYRA